ncbi:hypothetical protein [Halospeciosus flavus]|uniref:DUF7993 domain-containing protein n=1 Tax=Halospeciosus flavus TaxID=3032283 RepID=A0ABD5Z1D1_9EURY|nr:hypothetical protein [Halospeciosus flavus]
MVERELNDGVRIAQLLSSELTGREAGAFDRVEVTNVVDTADLEPTEFGERAYDVSFDGEQVGSVFVHPDRAHLELRDTVALDAARERASEEDLRVRPKAVEPPRLLVFVENGVEVKRVIDVLAAALEER